ncbi:hypothetical protein DSD31_04705 [Raoultella sp. X13]|nr:hypothetical protein DSD31_04705 [Raoultella sp. X13]
MLIYQNIVSLFVMVSAIHYKMLRWIAVFLLFQLASRGDLVFMPAFYVLLSFFKVELTHCILLFLYLFFCIAS